ncbi:monovalent cation/H(+) antiporter subunit G [Clostridium polynesiense]|uniref:monovalent cation/H(+) antiporter subunit G n=1 Tax=Clostridium polynesiense TaxID=1325933 RepID=UPI0006938A6E|nr:monovalent cation/H(+) antiporter subunit G [Clostridium polynesiense]
MITRIIIDLLFAVGVFFILAGVIGMLRMPDTFCRLQSSTNIVTMGSLPILIGCAVYGFYIGNSSIAVKSMIIAVFILLTNPAASHAMTKAAYRSGARDVNNSEYHCEEGEENNG